MPDTSHPLDLPIEGDDHESMVSPEAQRLCAVLTAAVAAVFPRRRFVLSAVRRVPPTGEATP